MCATRLRWNQPSSHKRCRLNGLEGKSSILIQAEEIQSKLDSKYPSFIKSLLKSHVTGGYWMGLPASFCLKNLPPKDTFVTLKTGSNKQYRVKYLAKKIGLSGWKKFVNSEKLSVGDVIVFHLVSATTFKVYIIQGNNSIELDKACVQLNSETPKEKTEVDMLNGTCKGKNFPEVDQRTMPPLEIDNNTPENSSRVTHGFPISVEITQNLEAVSTFDNFSITIDELLKDYDLPRHIKWSYYKLCCSQDSLLHDKLPKWMNHILVGGMIIETVTIADALRQCDLTTSKDEFSEWDKTLNALEILGMKIGFLREHLSNLVATVHDPDLASCRKKHAELCSENAQSEDEIKSLMAELTELRKVHSRRAVDIEILKMKIKNHELKFQEQVNTPW